MAYDPDYLNELAEEFEQRKLEDEVRGSPRPQPPASMIWPRAGLNQHSRIARIM